MKSLLITILIVLSSAIIASADEPVIISIVDLIHKTEAGEVKTAEYYIPSHARGIRGIMIQDGREASYKTHPFGESDDALLRFFHDHNVKSRRHPRKGYYLFEVLWLLFGPLLCIILLILFAIVNWKYEKLKKATNKKLQAIDAYAAKPDSSVRDEET